MFIYMHIYIYIYRYVFGSQDELSVSSSGACRYYTHRGEEVLERHVHGPVIPLIRA
jgi:hypothetical protein